MFYYYLREQILFMNLLYLCEIFQILLLLFLRSVPGETRVPMTMCKAFLLCANG